MVQRPRLLDSFLASFIALLDEVGFDKVTITALVEGVGVSSVTFYKHFETIEDCYAAAFDQSVAELGQVLAEAYESQSKWPQQIRAALAACLGYLAEVIERLVPYLIAGRELRPKKRRALAPEHRARPPRCDQRPHLPPADLTQFVLAPYLGTAAACRLAIGD